MGKASRQKGQRGEREVCQILAEHLGGEFKRNLMQTQEGGFDVLGLDEYAIEVKFQEKLQIEKWWEQTVEQAEDRIPVLFFRRSREEWRVVVPWCRYEDDPWDTKCYSIIPIDYFMEKINEVTGFEKETETSERMHRTSRKRTDKDIN